MNVRHANDYEMNENLDETRVGLRSKEMEHKQWWLICRSSATTKVTQEIGNKFNYRHGDGHKYWHLTTWSKNRRKNLVLLTFKRQHTQHFTKMYKGQKTYAKFTSITSLPSFVYIPIMNISHIHIPNTFIKPTNTSPSSLLNTHTCTCKHIPDTYYYAYTYPTLTLTHT